MDESATLELLGEAFERGEPVEVPDELVSRLPGEVEDEDPDFVSGVTITEEDADDAIRRFAAAASGPELKAALEGLLQQSYEQKLAFLHADEWVFPPDHVTKPPSKCVRKCERICQPVMQKVCRKVCEPRVPGGPIVCRPVCELVAKTVCKQVCVVICN
ncbi:MAG TPA: hypothetical protein VF752_02685 [Thermoleophilaceae bacterium]